MTYRFLQTTSDRSLVMKALQKSNMNHSPKQAAATDDATAAAADVIMGKILYS